MSYSVACLAGDGIGPEVMAQASLAVAAASHLHGFVLDERHVPFGADARMRFGHSFPHSSRNAVLDADAILVASVERRLLEELQDELDLRAAIVRVRCRGADGLTLVAPLRADAWAWTLDRAFEIARWSRADVTLVGSAEGWAAEAEAAEARHDGFAVSRVSSRRAIQALVTAPEAFDVVVCAEPMLEPLAEVAACLDGRRTSAWGRLAGSGPGVFGPAHGPEVDIAGQGVADPSSMLLGAALMLAEGLGERAAADTLCSALSSARSSGGGRADGVVTTSGELTEAVLAHLPSSFANAEFFYREPA